MERMPTALTEGPATGRELPLEWRDWKPVALAAVAVHDGQLVQLADVTPYVAARLVWALYERQEETPGRWRMVDTGIRLTPTEAPHGR